MQALQSILTVTFVVSSMFAMGLTMTLRQIMRPMRNVRAVLLTLLANFVIVPGVAYLLGMAIGDPDHQIGIILLGGVAGAPFVLKLTQIARGDLVLAVGLLVLLIVGTVVFMPLALPIMLPGIAVPAGAIARSLSLQMLLPLAIGLFVRARYKSGAREISPDAHKVANLALAFLLALLLTMNIRKVIGLFGTGVILATVALAVVGLASGWLAGTNPARRATVSLATSQRNFAAAFIVAGGSFSDRPNVMVYLAGAVVVLLVTNFVVAGEMRRRRKVPPDAGPEQREAAEEPVRTTFGARPAPPMPAPTTA